MNDLRAALYPRKVSTPKDLEKRAWQAWNSTSQLKMFANYAEILFTEINEGEDRRMGSKDVWLKDVAMPFLDSIANNLPEIGNLLNDLGDMIMMLSDDIRDSKANTAP